MGTTDWIVESDEKQILSQCMAEYYRAVAHWDLGKYGMYLVAALFTIQLVFWGYKIIDGMELFQEILND